MTINIHSKQFRAPRTRAGKIIKNRIGGCERPRKVELEYGALRRLKLTAAACSDVDPSELVGEHCDESKYCPNTGLEIPAGGGTVVEEMDGHRNDGPGRYLAVSYGADGRIITARTVDAREALRLMDEAA
ncbi:MAG: hypothetical protein K2X27_24365 [Candidatus Obscuribacterales bacterium]|nr:hypothetical protein [Candidatus Obscuribacterales bacterium]